jgi:hypothetical protein
MIKRECTYSDGELYVVSICLIDELRKVVEMGYGLLEFVEFWECEGTCFDRHKCWRSILRLVKHVTIIERGNIWITILGSM